MAYVSTGVGLSIPFHPKGLSSAPNITGNIFNAIGESYGAIFPAPIDGDITKIGFNIGNIGANLDLDVRIETVDPTTGFPSGTLWGTNTNIVRTLVNGVDDAAGAAGNWIEVTLTSAATVSRSSGDYFAVVLVYNSASTSSLPINYYADSFAVGSPGLYFKNPTPSWVYSASGAPLISVYFDGVGYYPFREVFPYEQLNAINFNTTSSPIMRGNTFTPYTNMKTDGPWIAIDNDTDFEIVLFDSNGTTEIGNVSGSVNLPVSNGPNLLNLIWEQGTITLTSGQTYYLMVKPVTAGTNIGVYEQTFENNTLKELLIPSYAEAATLTTTTPSGTGDYTITDTSAYMIGLTLQKLIFQMRLAV